MEPNHDYDHDSQPAYREPAPSARKLSDIGKEGVAQARERLGAPPPVERRALPPLPPPMREPAHPELGDERTEFMHQALQVHLARGGVASANARDAINAAFDVVVAARQPSLFADQPETSTP